MMVLHFNTIWFSVWMLWCCLMFIKGDELCTSYFINRSNISIKLQSDVLLPCNFDPTLLGSDKTADIAVVWSTKNTTIIHLVEIPLQGNVDFWDSKGERIKTFPNLSESGNFSILLQKVQPYDLGFYHCELFNGTGCRIVYQELHLGLTTVSQPQTQKSIIAGASVVAVLLCLFITCVCSKSKERKYQLEPESSHEYCYTEVMYTLHSTNSHENH